MKGQFDYQELVVANVIIPLGYGQFLLKIKPQDEAWAFLPIAEREQL